MKFLLKLWVVILCSCPNSNATSKGYPKLSTAYLIEGSLREKLSNLPLPSSWDEIEPVVEIRKMDPRGSLHTMKTINSFALVPGAPVIFKEDGISREYYGKRLFLISRTEEAVPSGSPGRCVILIDPQDTDPNAMRTYSHFIPEETAQIILKQIKEFDPLRQPLAFKNFDQLERNKQNQQDQLNEQIRKQFKETGQLGPNDEPITDSKEFTREWNYGLLLAVGVSFCVFLFWRVLRRPSA